MLFDSYVCEEYFSNIKLMSIIWYITFLVLRVAWKQTFGGDELFLFTLRGLLILKLTEENGNISCFIANRFSRTAWFVHVNPKLPPSMAETLSLPHHNHLHPCSEVMCRPKAHQLWCQKLWLKDDQLGRGAHLLQREVWHLRNRRLLCNSYPVAVCSGRQGALTQG